MVLRPRQDDALASSKKNSSKNKNKERKKVTFKITEDAKQTGFGKDKTRQDLTRSTKNSLSAKTQISKNKRKIKVL